MSQRVQYVEYDELKIGERTSLSRIPDLYTQLRQVFLALFGLAASSPHFSDRIRFLLAEFANDTERYEAELCACERHLFMRAFDGLNAGFVKDAATTRTLDVGLAGGGLLPRRTLETDAKITEGANDQGRVEPFASPWCLLGAFLHSGGGFDVGCSSRGMPTRIWMFDARKSIPEVPGEICADENLVFFRFERVL
ncbi:hypothetical protein Trydic_g2872 [Trypoxylus dichotomus]